MGVSHVGTIGGQKPMGHYNLAVPQSGPVSLPGFSAIDKNLVRIIVLRDVPVVTDVGAAVVVEAPL